MRAVSNYKASTRVGADGFHPKVPWDLSEETCGKIVVILAKVEQCGHWSVQTSTLLHFLIPKTVTSERPIALLPTLIRWWEWCRVNGAVQKEVMEEQKEQLGKHCWKWKGINYKCGRNGSRSCHLGCRFSHSVWKSFVRCCMGLGKCKLRYVIKKLSYH